MSAIETVEATGAVEAPRGPTIEIDGVLCDLDKVKQAAGNIVRALLHIQAFELTMPDDEIQVETKSLLAELKTILRGDDAHTD